MNFDDANILAFLYSNMDVFLVIFMRIIGFIIIVPVISINSIPIYVKVSFAFFLSFIVFTFGNYNFIPEYSSFIGFSFVLIEEFIVGIILGFVIYTVLSIMLFMGQLVDFEMGFSMTNVFDPLTQIQIPITGNLFYYIAAIFFIISDGLNTFIAGLFFSYQVVPISSAILYSNYNLFASMINLVSNYFMLGLQISLPIIASIFIVNIVLGILVKAVPQVNVFVVGIPLKLIIALIILYIISPIMSLIYENLFDLMSNYFISTTRSLLQ